MPPAPPLITGLRAQPLLVVLRPGQPRLASQALERLLDLGLRHVEIAWQPLPCWVEQMADLVVLQNAYQASAQVIRAANEVFRMLIDIAR